MENKVYTFHLLGLAHLPAHAKFSSCAFTQKNRKLAKMLLSMGHTVYFYGCDGSDILEYCANEPGELHYIRTHSLDDLRQDYGNGWNLDSFPELYYDWTVSNFKHDLSSTEKKPSTLKFFESCIRIINQVKKADDFLLCTQGAYHRPIAEAVKLTLNCESGIGYRGWAEEMFHCFESYYGMHFLYGSDKPFASLNGRYYDRRIFNYFDLNDYEFSDTKEDYFLFIGRMIKRKGVMTAYLATQATGDKLIFAGQGASVQPDGSLMDETTPEYPTPEFNIPAGHWQYIGFADVETRKKLMSKAKAVFVATEYLEMFGGVAAEAMLSGTPVITTSFGVFPEYNIHGKTGFLCHTLQDFVNAVEACKNFTKENYNFIRNYALENFDMHVIKHQYQKWFDDLYQVYESIEYKGVKAWHRINKKTS